MPAEQCKILDLRLVAAHCGVDKLTPQQWRQRDLLPPVDFPDIKGCPLWYAQTIKNWAIRTGRNFWDDPANKRYIDVFTEDEDPEEDTPVTEDVSESPRIPGLVFSAPS